MNAASSRSLAARIASGLVVSPPAAARTRLGQFTGQVGGRGAQPAAGGGGESSSTAIVPAADASHQPSRRLGMVAAPPAEATGST